MEIISIPLEGNLKQKDNLGNEIGITLAIFITIVSSVENKNRNINFGDLIVYNENAECMDKIGIVSEAIATKNKKLWRQAPM